MTDSQASVKVGIVFSKPLSAGNPLKHMGEKYPVYIRFLEFCQAEGWDVFVLTQKTYLGKGAFGGGWVFDKKTKTKFKLTNKILMTDLIYDRTGGLKFPPKEDGLRSVNSREFKILSWDKWSAYQEMKKYMPRTFRVGERRDLAKVLPEIRTQKVVLKPANGLKGIGVFIGAKEQATKFVFPDKYPKYIAQEFVDTFEGIPGITNGLHDLRVVIINGKIVWSHVRIPPRGSLQANVARGGKIKEIDCLQIPDYVTKIVRRIAKSFYVKYDNPVYSIDFGIEKGKPYIFEINDQIGFPRWEMKARDVFLTELIYNFAQKAVKNEKTINFTG